MSCPARLMFIQHIRGIEFFWRDKILIFQPVARLRCLALQSEQGKMNGLSGFYCQNG